MGIPITGLFEPSGGAGAFKLYTPADIETGTIGAGVILTLGAGARITADGINGEILPQIGAGIPSHSASEGVPYWDTTNNKFYVNNDGSTAWTEITGGAGGVDTSGTPVANDFARFIDADTIEGRSYAETKADLNLEIGTDVLAEQTIGIANNNLVEIDHAAVADNDYGKFTVNGLEGRSYGELRSDINVADGADVTGNNAPQAHKDSHDPNNGGDALDTAAPAELASVQASGVGTSHSLARADHAHQIQHSIANNHLVTIDHASVADNDYAKFTASGLEGKSYSEVRSDIGLKIYKTFGAENPTSSEDFPGTHFTDVAITISKIVAVLKGTSPSVTWTMRHGTDRSAAGNEVVTGGTTTTNTTTGEVITSFNDATIPANSHIWIETTAASGTISWISINLIASID